MFIFSSLRKKVYYRFLSYYNNYNSVSLSKQMKERKNVFLYFDYEREFGGHKTTISNSNIDELLNFLSKNRLKTSWFTVGKILRVYPESIESIICNGHEIASHTYAHIAPINQSKKHLREDFEKFHNGLFQDISVKGFHAPNGKWSLALIKLLPEFGYSYDVISAGKKGARVEMIKHRNAKSTLRFTSFGDDWPLLKKPVNEDIVFHHFVSLFEKIPKGHVGGIGAHPWVLFSQPEIWLGYKRFVKYLQQQKDVRVETAGFFAEEIIENNNEKVRNS